MRCTCSLNEPPMDAMWSLRPIVGAAFFSFSCFSFFSLCTAFDTLLFFEWVSDCERVKSYSALTWAASFPRGLQFSSSHQSAVLSFPSQVPPDCLHIFPSCTQYCRKCWSSCKKNKITSPSAPHLQNSSSDQFKIIGVSGWCGGHCLHLPHCNLGPIQ